MITKMQKERLTALWQRELVDRCCISVTYTPDESNEAFDEIPDDPEGRQRYWTDGKTIIERYMKRHKETYYAGEALPILTLNLGAAGHTAYFKGANASYNDSIWHNHFMNELSSDGLIFDKETYMYRKTLELAQYFVDHCKDTFLVSQPDNCGNLDALAAAYGTEKLLMDMAFGMKDEEIHKCLDKIQHAWEVSMDDVSKIVMDHNQGGTCVGWMHLWSPGRMAQMQVDLSAMISNPDYEKYARKELEIQSAKLDNVVYHLDGMEQIRHLDTLLSIDDIDMIQWTAVEGQPRPTKFIDEFKRIQGAGKALLLQANPDEVSYLMENLSSKGLFIVTYANSVKEAEDLVKLAGKLTRT